MSKQIPKAGAACQALRDKSHQWWLFEAQAAGIDLSEFNPETSLDDRQNWASGIGIGIGAILSRYSTAMQHSTESQVQESIRFAARNHIYIPPELICVDEAQSGKRVKRDGIERIKFILKHGFATVLLVFKMSRLLRSGYKSFAFINETVVEEGLRAVSVSQGIDTQDEKSWKSLMYLHGMMDELLLDTIADHCRAGLANLFGEGYVTGALTVGYEGEEAAGAPLTNRGLPRRRPKVVKKIKKLIRKHYEWIRDGMPIREGLKKWHAENGPCDPRSTTGRMSYPAYRRMLSNPRYLGVWAFGRKKNSWSSKRDYNRQVEQPESEVKLFRCEELRIVSDKLFYEVQKVLAENKRGPRGPRPNKPKRLWDLVTGCFYCDACSADGELIRMYQGGKNNESMFCKSGVLCKVPSSIRRDDAVRAVCDELQTHLCRDKSLIEKVASLAVELDEQDDDQIEERRRDLKKCLRTLKTQIEDLYDLTGQGSDSDRKEVKSQIQKRQAERARVQADLANIQPGVLAQQKTLTVESAKTTLLDLRELLESAATGALGEDCIHRAAAIFKQLTGGKVMVHVEPRPNRKQTNVRGEFQVHLESTVAAAVDAESRLGGTPSGQVSVWLREPPRCDRLASEVHKLIDIQGESFRGAAKLLRSQGHQINSGVVWQIYHRYYEMIGQQPPDRPYNNGALRKAK